MNYKISELCEITSSKRIFASEYTDDERYKRFKTTIHPVSGTTEGGSASKYISVLNKADDNVKSYTTFYKLRACEKDETYVYDLSVYENS